MTKKKENPDVGGRPTSWKPEYNEMLVEFFDIQPSTTTRVSYTDKQGNEREKEVDKANPLPTFEKFACEIGVHVDTMIEWAKAANKDKYPGFSESYTRAKQLQKHILITNGLLGAYESRFAKFVAMNCTDMRDGTLGEKDNPIHVKTTTSVTPEQVARFIKRHGKDRAE